MVYSTGGKFGNSVESASWNQFLVQVTAIAPERRQARRDKVVHPTSVPNCDMYSTGPVQAVQILVAAQAVAIQLLAVVVGDTACSQMDHDWVNPSSVRSGN